MPALTELVVFDLDGTIVHNPDFYKQVYSGSLTRLIEREKGENGLRILTDYRERCGKGELALFALGIPFSMWAEALINAPLDLLAPEPELVSAIRELGAIKVVYTGSPLAMATKVLDHLGFSREDFDLIVGWEEPEVLPVKWTNSPLVFEKILLQFGVKPRNAWSVGDSWDSDLLPAKTVGMRTAGIWKKNGQPDFHFRTLAEFVQELSDPDPH